MEERWALQSEAIAREVGGKIFLILPDGTLHILENATAVVIYKRLAGAGPEGASAGALAAALAEAFQVDLATAERDVWAFLTTLEGLGVVARGVREHRSHSSKAV